jgi:serine/threonine protein kinase/WD40 repeat protein
MPADPRRVKELFGAALDLPDAPARQALLERECSDDSELRHRVEVLLAAHNQPESMLERPLAIQTESATDTFRPRTETAGTVIVDRYKLLEEIGEGGMGTVWMAQQTEPVKRTVAVKLIKPGMDSRQVLARFEAERQALALMDHPNIAKVFDAGAAPDGRPFFAMELVKGVPITRYCDDHHLTPRQRLELFVPVCHAIQHAHQKGIIHRDLKPSNVLIALYDDKPIPKIIDFGVAKATGQQLTEQTLHTGFGAVVGTVEYMSPEQASFNNLDIDTRSDIYSLGVLLYELLAGSPPFSKKELEQAGLLEMFRVIREQEPSKPSTKLSTAEGLPTLAANRGTEPAKLTKLVRGELDWIVMKSLEKDRNRRYETANGFAMDVQRYLADEAVLACPPSAAYRLRKFTRRNKVGLFITASLLVALLVALSAGLVVMWRENQWSSRALHQATMTERTQRELLAKAYLEEARARRTSGRVGQRFESLKKIKEATQIARDLDLPPAFIQQLRNEAISCLALPDVEVAHEWDGYPPGSDLVDFDPTFELYARSDSQGNISVRRVRDDGEIARLPGDGPNLIPHFSPDSHFLATQGHAGRLGVKVWRLEGSSSSIVLAEPRSWEGKVDFSPDGRLFAAGCDDGTIAIYDLPSGRPLRRLKSQALGPNGYLKFHPNEPVFALMANDRKAVQIVDAESGKVRAELPQARVHHIAWHPDGRMLAVACDDRKIYLWDTHECRRLSVLEGHQGHGILVRFNHAGDLLVSNDHSNILRLWDPQTGQQLINRPALWTPVMRISRDDKLVGPDRVGNQLRILRIADGREFRGLPRPTRVNASLGNAILSPDGQLIVASVNDSDGTHGLIFINANRREKLAFFHGKGTQPLMFEPSGDLLIQSGSGIFRWPLTKDAANPRMHRFGPSVPIIPPNYGTFCKVGPSADGRMFALPYCDEGTLVVHRDRQGETRIFSPQADVRSSAVSRDGRWVAAGSEHTWAESVKIWDGRTGKHVKDLPVYESSAVWFSPDDRWLVTTGGGVRLWRVGSWEEGPPIAGTRTFAGVAFSPDSNFLALIDEFGAVRCVDPNSGKDVARLEAPLQSRFVPRCFSPDSGRLICHASELNALYVWDLRAIREQLAKMGLDWDAKPLPPAPQAGDTKLARLDVDLGDLLDRERYSLILAFFPFHAEAYFRRGLAYVRFEQWRQALDDFDRAIVLRPDRLPEWNRALDVELQRESLSLRRANAYVQLRQYDKAIADFAKLVENEPHYAELWYRLALLRLYTGDTNGYGKLCADMVQRFGQTAGDLDRHHLVWACSIGENAVADFRPVLQAAQELEAHDSKYWHDANRLGLALYRAGRLQEALEKLDEAEKLAGNVWNYGHWITALVNCRLGRADKAKKRLADTDAWFADHAKELPWDHRLLIEAFRREAYQLLGAKAPTLAGPESPILKEGK